MSSLKNFCKAVGLPKLKTWKEAICCVKKGMDKENKEETIEWPMVWKDRRSTRRFDDTKNYPAAAPGIVYDRQIAIVLGQSTTERVRSFHMYPDAEGNMLPRDWLKPDKYYSYYCTEDRAIKILKQMQDYYKRERKS